LFELCHGHISGLHWFIILRVLPCWIILRYHWTVSSFQLCSRIIFRFYRSDSVHELFSWVLCFVDRVEFLHCLPIRILLLIGRPIDS